MVGQGEWYGEADLFQGDAHLRFDGLYGNMQEFSHFPVFKIAFFYQEEDKFAFGGELIDHLIYMPHHFGGDQYLFGACLPFDGEVMKTFLQLLYRQPP